MELIADFCYGHPIDERLDTHNIASVLCASRYFQMSGSRNLTKACRDKLARLSSTNASNCLDILVNCVECGHEAEEEGIVCQCIEAAVNHWCKVELREGNKCERSDNEMRWQTLLGSIPVNWFALIIETMQIEQCQVSLITYFVAGYMEGIVECFTNAGPSLCGNPVTELQVNGPTAGSLEQSITHNSSNHLISNQLVPVSFEETSVLLKAFETLLAYIPDAAPRLDVVRTEWFTNALRFASEHSLKATARLVAICASVVDKLTLDNVEYFEPMILVELNREVEANKSELAPAVAQLTDQYLNYRVLRRSLTASQFALLLQSTSWCCRTSYDSAFRSLEKMLELTQDSSEMSDKDVEEIMAAVDFTKLSEEALWRAAECDKIPAKSTLAASLAVGSLLRAELQKTKDELQKKDDEVQVLSSTLAQTTSALDEEVEKIKH